MKVNVNTLLEIGKLIGPAGAIIGTVVQAFQAIASQPGRDPATPIGAEEVLAVLAEDRAISQSIRDTIADERRKLSGG